MAFSFKDCFINLFSLKFKFNIKKIPLDAEFLLGQHFNSHIEEEPKLSVHFELFSMERKERKSRQKT